ncbi:MAG: Gfo/Idh/MocA family oxidoreductase [Candidatus Bathyarchaeia archaeon]
MQPATDGFSEVGRMGEDTLLKVGVLTCGPWSHMSIWAPIINAAEGRVRMTGMRLSHVWDIDRADAEAFGKRFGVLVVENFDEMVGKVDAVILSDFDAAPVFKQLSRPYIEAGIPIFINRPFAFNLRDAREMLDLAKRHDTPVMCGSSFEYVKEVQIIRSKVKAIEPIAGYVADNSMSDYATHGVHGLYFVYACLGGGVRSVSYQTPDWRSPNGVVILEHEGREGGKRFYGCVQQVEGAGTNAWIKVYGKGYIEQSVWWEGSNWDRDLFLWLPMLLKMEQMFTTREMPEPYEHIYEKTQIFLAGFKSHVEKKGAPVALTEIGDWQAPLLGPPRYPPGFPS